MEYKKFKEIVDSLQKYDNTISSLYEHGVDLINFTDSLHNIIKILLEEVYGDEGYDWFCWFCYENDYGKKDWSKLKVLNEETESRKPLSKNENKPGYGARDKNGKPICFSIKSTWEFLEKNHSQIKK